MTTDAAGQSMSDPEMADEGDDSDVPTPTLLMGILTAVAAGGFVGWALLPLSTPVAGLPLYAVAAVATTLWSGIAFLRRKLPTGVLAEGFYLMGVAVLARPVSVALALDGLPAFLADPGAVFMTFIVAAVFATLLLVAGWRLDTHARKTRVRRMRRRVTRRMSRKQAQKGPMPSGMADSEGGSHSQGSNGNGSVRTEQEP
ncbi:hypothetical protein [Haloglomus halophilum]|uniref:hypothetical protein n=1 Tax=Haloglomus halophilum TaxID=2962672 RepID=UPI0020C98663|nr:hypothetical protein [Haloglomus halophilum]